jgi:thioredoxin 1
VREVTKETFQEVTGQGTVLIDVWGPTCAPCIAMMPKIEAFSKEVQGVEIVKLDSTKNRRLCMEHRIMGMPAFLLFHEGKEVSRIGGNDLTFEAMKSWLDGHLQNLHQPPQPS